LIVWAKAGALNKEAAIAIADNWILNFINSPQY
jgi:hypothetical protein